MICAIHQPQFLPWLGYLNKVAMADVFVFLDDVQFKKNEFQNRNRIRVAGEAHWITVPVSFDFGDPINRVRIATDKPWRRKMRNAIQMNYAQAPFYNDYSAGLFDLLDRDWANLAELNEASVRWLLDCFSVGTKLARSSDMTALSNDPGQRLVDICRNVGADTYLSGAGGHDYLDAATFERSGLTLKFQEFLHPVYTQCYSPGREQFIPQLSAVDGLFNCGGSAGGRKALNI